jgi:hypothetical protein
MMCEDFMALLGICWRKDSSSITDKDFGFGKAAVAVIASKFVTHFWMEYIKWM